MKSEREREKKKDDNTLKWMSWKLSCGEKLPEDQESRQEEKNVAIWSLVASSGHWPIMKAPPPMTSWPRPFWKFDRILLHSAPEIMVINFRFCCFGQFFYVSSHMGSDIFRADLTELWSMTLGPPSSPVSSSDMESKKANTLWKVVQKCSRPIVLLKSIHCSYDKLVSSLFPPK